MTSHWMALLLTVASASALAQSNDAGQGTEVGAKPPVMSLREVLKSQAEAAKSDNSLIVRDSDEPLLGEQGTVVDPTAPKEQPVPVQPPEESSAPPIAESTPIEDPRTSPKTTGPVTTVGTSRVQQTNGSKPRQPNRDFVKPAPAQLTVASGENHVIGISYSHLNRIITPFRNPVVKTTSLATTTAEGSIVYVATNLSDPVALFIHDEFQPDVAISLTLVPAEIPPISTTVTIRGYDPDAVPRITPKVSLATAFEQQHTYLDMLKTLFRDLALGKVPDGYGFQTIQGFDPDMPSCMIPGVHVIPLQLVTGSSLRVFVGKAQNTGRVVAEIREDSCSGIGLRAVAAWPKTTLAPGEAVELYLALDTVVESDAAVQRPSVLGGRQ